MNWVTLVLEIFEHVWANMLAMLLPMTLCVMGICLVERTWHDCSPRLRSWLWRLFFIKCAVGLAGVSFAFQSFVPLQSMMPSIGGGAMFGGAPADTTAGQLSVSVHPLAVSNTELASLSGQQISWKFLVPTCWLIGVAIVAAMMVRNYGRLAHIVYRGSRDLPVEVATAYRRLTLRLGIGRPPRLLLVTMLPGPAVTYCGRTYVLLPRLFSDNYGQSSFEIAVTHELAHWSRRDLQWNWFVSLVGLVFFYFPPMWLAMRRYRLAQELACDAWTLRRGRIEPARYADLLVKVVERSVAGRSPWALSMSSLSLARTETFQTLKERLNAMKPVRSNSPMRMLAGCMLFVVVIGLVLPWSGHAVADERPSGKKAKSRMPLGSQRSTAPATNGGTASAFSFGQAFSSAGGSAGGYSNGTGNVQGYVSGGGFAAVGTPNMQSPTYPSETGSLPGIQMPNLAAAGFPGIPMMDELTNQMKMQATPMAGMQRWNSTNMNPGTSVSTASQMVDGELLTVTTVLDKQREITIRRSDSEGIEVRIRQRGKKAAVETHTADTMAELEKNTPDIHKLIAPYVSENRELRPMIQALPQ